MTIKRPLSGMILAGVFFCRSANGKDFSLSHDLHWWINESLIVIFFFVVGLEIKREVLIGELSTLRQAALPIVAAIGGMLLPAAFYALINWGTPGSRGWGVPMATDIAFALGVMALLGSRLPLGLKVFLTALVIVDDIGAVLVIALFYHANHEPHSIPLRKATSPL